MLRPFLKSCRMAALGLTALFAPNLAAAQDSNLTTIPLMIMPSPVDARLAGAARSVQARMVAATVADGSQIFYAWQPDSDLGNGVFVGTLVQGDGTLNLVLGIAGEDSQPAQQWVSVVSVACPVPTARQCADQIADLGFEEATKVLGGLIAAIF